MAAIENKYRNIEGKVHNKDHCGKKKYTEDLKKESTMNVKSGIVD